ncbi:hypothetical protein ACELLULO517_05660 [Acidisoma cellulosilytica]|uniref:F5/8 type C domain-containing protein n=1 Tax=Acidisoma cellulosilyticum TaxID=2802395 RepID=A0A963YZ17_9PROT|nr:hypothetical protein [Acidisoma cellulosilyticum]MCB8879711.1 hypothetical protein [Acidisoma cellulosilyticum]
MRFLDKMAGLWSFGKETAPSRAGIASADVASDEALPVMTSTSQTEDEIPDADAQPPDVWETDHYRITHYRSNPHRLTIVFASAGQHGIGAPIEEFKGSLLKLSTSIVFVIDNNAAWCNHPDFPAAIAIVQTLLGQYENIGALGESMGASSAIVFAELCPDVDRILAIAPQYSIMAPFIDFDERFARLGQEHPDQRYPAYSCRSATSKAQILFGNLDWKDLVHAGMYKVDGFSVSIVEGAAHLVAGHLKSQQKLIPVLKRFLDYSVPFTASAVQSIIGKPLADPCKLNGVGFVHQSQWTRNWQAAAQSPKRIAPPPRTSDLALGRPTDQSSLSDHSRGTTTQEDSAGAVQGVLSGSYAFHTAMEAGPWWLVSLEAVSKIQEVRIHNRLENRFVCHRGARFAIDLMDASGIWVEHFVKQDDLLFGGADGEPFRWTPAKPVPAQSLRIRLLGQDFLHYDAVEVFGILPPG